MAETVADMLWSAAARQGEPRGGAHPGVHPTLTELVALVDKLTQQNLELAGRVGFLQAQNQQLHKALEAPKVVRATVPEDEGPSRDTTGPWGRFLRWLYAPV